MTQQDKEQLKLEIDHIFESGANEIRIFEMVVNFIDSRNGVNKNFVLADVSGSLLAAGKLALAARLVTTANAKNLSQRIEQMEAALDAYDNEIFSLSNDR